MAAEVPTLHRLVLCIALKGESAAPSDVLKCLDLEAASDDQNWIQYLKITDDDGSCRLSAHECMAEEHDFHATLEFRRRWRTTNDSASERTLSEVVNCFSALRDQVDDVDVTVSFAFPSNEYGSVLDGHRHSFSNRDSVRLTGVELDFQESELPIDSIQISEGSKEILLSMDMSRSFEEGDDWITEIRQRTVDIAQSFIHTPTALKESLAPEADAD